MAGLFDGTPLERPVTCEACEQPLDRCRCPRDASGRVVFPRDQMVRVRLERRRKGKSVTVASGLDPVANELADLLRELKQRCGTGGTINDDGIELQGDHRDSLASFLVQKGYRIRS